MSERLVTEADHEALIEAIQNGTEADFLDSIVRREVAKAWAEGHKHPWKRDWNDGCVCGAYNSGECACGMYGAGELLSLKDNPYESGGQS